MTTWTEEDACFVYLLAHSGPEHPVGPVKVGYSKNPTKRLASLQTGNPRSVVSVFAFLTPNTEMAAAAEKTFHRLHAKQRMAGEWFDLSPKFALNTLTKVIIACISEGITDPDQAAAVMEYVGVLDAAVLHQSLPGVLP